MTIDLREAVAALRAGEIVCVPTESSYGLAVDVRQPRALAAVAALKGRASESPFAVIAADLEQARSLASSWPRAADELAARHWPGPLTLVVPACPDLPELLIGGGGGVGVRVSSHPVPASLARRLGAPICATSANPSGEPAATDVPTARRYFGDAVAVYVDGGGCEGTPSTVVAVGDSGELTVLREGAIATSGLSRPQ